MPHDDHHLVPDAAEVHDLEEARERGWRRRFSRSRPAPAQEPYPGLTWFEVLDARGLTRPLLDYTVERARRLADLSPHPLADPPRLTGDPRVEVGREALGLLNGAREEAQRMSFEAAMAGRDDQARRLADLGTELASLVGLFGRLLENR